MEKYDYRAAMIEDIMEYIKEEISSEEISGYTDRYELEEMLNDRLWVEDSVTGNASGSYTFSTWKADEYICHNLDLLADALAEFGASPSVVLSKGAEYCDVTIRCYLLNECISAALDQMGIMAD